MDRLERERLWLQRVVGVAGLVPVGAGLYGVVFGAALTGDAGLSLSGSSHYRYLSGLLLAIGLMYWSGIPAIETRKGRFQLLTLIVVIGGLSRLVGLLLTGVPSLIMIAALVMELVVTPLICLWQMRIARRYPPATTLRAAAPTKVKS